MHELKRPTKTHNDEVCFAYEKVKNKMNTELSVLITPEQNRPLQPRDSRKHSVKPRGNTSSNGLRIRMAMITYHPDAETTGKAGNGEIKG